ERAVALRLRARPVAPRDDRNRSARADDGAVDGIEREIERDSAVGRRLKELRAEVRVFHEDVDEEPTGALVAGHVARLHRVLEPLADVHVHLRAVGAELDGRSRGRRERRAGRRVARLAVSADGGGASAVEARGRVAAAVFAAGRVRAAVVAGPTHRAAARGSSCPAARVLRVAARGSCPTAAARFRLGAGRTVTLTRGRADAVAPTQPAAPALRGWTWHRPRKSTPAWRVKSLCIGGLKERMHTSSAEIDRALEIRASSGRLPYSEGSARRGPRQVHQVQGALDSSDRLRGVPARADAGTNPLRAYDDRPAAARVGADTHPRQGCP